MKKYLVSHPNSEHRALVFARTPEEAVSLLFNEQDLINGNQGVSVTVEEVLTLVVQTQPDVVIGSEDF